jgi:hypothetical protein
MYVLITNNNNNNSVYDIEYNTYRTLSSSVRAIRSRHACRARNTAN